MHETTIFHKVDHSKAGDKSVHIGNGTGVVQLQYCCSDHQVTDCALTYHCSRTMYRLTGEFSFSKIALGPPPPPLLRVPSRWVAGSEGGAPVSLRRALVTPGRAPVTPGHAPVWVGQPKSQAGPIPPPPPVSLSNPLCPPQADSCRGL